MAVKNEKGLFVKDVNFYRVPRKKKKQIPKQTFYCYTITSGMKLFKDGKYGYETKVCPFWDFMKYKEMHPRPSWLDDEFIEKYGEERDGWCKLVKCTVDDQCKSCGIK